MRRPASRRFASMRLAPRAKRNAPERRVVCRVLARRLTGQPDPWLLVGDFECDASEFRAEMRAVAESLNSERSGDMLAFRVRPNVEKTGSFYWYLSPQRGPLPVPKADPVVFLSKAKPGMDWLSVWVRSDSTLSLFAGLASFNIGMAEKALWEAYDETVTALRLHPAIMAFPARNNVGLAALVRGAAVPDPERLPSAQVIRDMLRITRDARGYGRAKTLDEWRREIVHPFVSAITKARAMLAVNRVEDSFDWNDPTLKEAALDVRDALNAWVRSLVSLDVLAMALRTAEGQRT